MTLKILILRYSAFAAIAILVNLATQELVLMAGGRTDVWVAIAVVAGTGTGLVVKYLLDKRWIFDDPNAAIGQQFALYTVMGIATTVIFWGSVALAWAIWGTDAARIAGAIFGLTIGYVTKYMLDRRYVFTDARLQVA
ncbi:MAG: GtrA family protein [Pseudomonadota bacterium]